MKRRNVDSAKIRRALKKNKISEGLCGSSLIYLKLLLVWALVMTADILLELRFEYLWPFWLLLRSIYDSFRYQGVAFSVFFVCITVTSDMVCFLFIPVQWLFFLASTYVWVQYVWHADRGVCLPTVSLWLLFIYVEASIRLKELRSVPFTLDLCRPFAAHCIGYPVATLGFGVKSYVSYRMRMRKQREVARINEVYTRLLAESLSGEQRLDGEVEKYRYLTSQMSSEDIISNGAVCINQQHQSIMANQNDVTVSATTARQSTKNLNVASALPKKTSVSSAYPLALNNYLTSSAAGRVSNCGGPLLTAYATNGDAEMEDEYEADRANNADAVRWILNIIKRKLFGVYTAGSCSGSAGSPPSVSMNTTSSWCHLSSWSSASMLRDSDDESRDSREGGVGAECQLVKRLSLASSSFGNGSASGKQKTKRRGYVFTANSPLTDGVLNHQRSVDATNTKDANGPQVSLENKDKVQEKDLYVSLESDVEKLKTELRSGRGREQELRNQVQQMTATEKAVKCELQQLRQNNEQLQTRVQNLVRARQQDKQNMITMEKKLADEQKMKSQVEQQLQQEKKQKKADEASRNANAASKADCNDTCKQRRRELEGQAKQLRRDLQQREEQVVQFDNELRALRQYKEQHNTEILMSALSAMQEKNMHLESSLSAETRVKLDLFSALGEAKRQLEISQGQLVKKEQELEELRRRTNGDVYMSPALSSTGSSMFPCSAVGMTTAATSLQAASVDLLGSAAYQTASYMTNLPGLMFDERTIGSDYGGMAMTGEQRLPVPSDGVIRYTPPKTTSH